MRVLVHEGLQPRKGCIDFVVGDLVDVDARADARRQRHTWLGSRLALEPGLGLGLGLGVGLGLGLGLGARSSPSRCTTISSRARL